jgi:hypothetical protein
MNLNLRGIVFTMILVSLVNCVNPSKSTLRQPIGLVDIEKIQIGTFNRSEAKERFDAPREIVNLPDSNSLEAWIYVDQSHISTRVSLIFDRNSGVLKRKTWFVRGGEPEADINSVKARYPLAQFESRPAKNRNPHFISDKIIYTDQSSGLSVSYRKSANEVEALSWSDPKTRSVADIPKISKPNFDWTP